MPRGRCENRPDRNFTPGLFPEVMQDLGACDLFLVNQAGLTQGRGLFYFEIKP